MTEVIVIPGNNKVESIEKQSNERDRKEKKVNKKISKNVKKKPE